MFHLACYKSHHAGIGFNVHACRVFILLKLFSNIFFHNFEGELIYVNLNAVN